MLRETTSNRYPPVQAERRFLPEGKPEDLSVPHANLVLSFAGRRDRLIRKSAESDSR